MILSSPINDRYFHVSPTNRIHIWDLILFCYEFRRYVEHMLTCEICSIHNEILIVLEFLPMNVADSIVTAINIHQIIEFSSTLPATLEFFSRLIIYFIHDCSWFYRQFQFCFIVSHGGILRSCHVLRIDIIRLPWSITKCFSVPYGLRGSVENNFFVIRSNSSYHPRSLNKSLLSIVRRSFSFPLLRKPSTVVIQFWIICWREGFHELLMEVMIRGFK